MRPSLANTKGVALHAQHKGASTADAPHEHRRHTWRRTPRIAKHMHGSLVSANPRAHLLDAALQDLEPPTQSKSELLVNYAGPLLLLRHYWPDHRSTQPLERVLRRPLQSARQLTGFAPWQAASFQDVLDPSGPFDNLVVRRLQCNPQLSDLRLDAQDHQRVAFAALLCLDRILPQADSDQPSRLQQDYNKVCTHRPHSAHLTKQSMALLEHSDLSAE